MHGEISKRFAPIFPRNRRKKSPRAKCECVFPLRTMALRRHIRCSTKQAADSGENEEPKQTKEWSVCNWDKLIKKEIKKTKNEREGGEMLDKRRLKSKTPSSKIIVD